jgi:hypothetical protein
MNIIYAMAGSHSFRFFLERVEEVRDSPKFFKILRIEMKNYSHHLDNGNVLNRSSMDISPFITNLSGEI